MIHLYNLEGGTVKYEYTCDSAAGTHPLHVPAQEQGSFHPLDEWSSSAIR